MKQLVCGIFVGLGKAFDIVNHQILCDKLNYYGFRGGFNVSMDLHLNDRKQLFLSMVLS